jgi:molybdopterin converting factor subunit 1
VVESAAQPEAGARIRVQVRLFAAYRESTGTSRLDVSLPAGARVANLVETLRDRLPALGGGQGLAAVNQDYVGLDFGLRDGDEVALIPPVSGGR